MNIRMRGLVQLLLSGAIFYLLLKSFMALNQSQPTSTLTTLSFYGLAVPGGFAIAGFVQMVSGTPFSKLSEKWNSLKGWQRGVYGTSIFLGVAVLVFGSLFLYASLGS